MDVKTIAVIGAGTMGRGLRTQLRLAVTTQCLKTFRARCLNKELRGSGNRLKKEWRETSSSTVL